jgi:hypothetical protein
MAAASHCHWRRWGEKLAVGRREDGEIHDGVALASQVPDGERRRHHVERFRGREVERRNDRAVRQVEVAAYDEPRRRCLRRANRKQILRPGRDAVDGEIESLPRHDARSRQWSDRDERGFRRRNSRDGTTQRLERAR